MELKGFLNRLFSASILIILAVCMLFTGTLNTIATKMQDVQIVKGYTNQPPVEFEHPFFQTLIMFIGEFSCLWVFYGTSAFNSLVSKLRNKKSDSDSEGSEVVVEKKKKANPLFLGIPALLDLLGTTMLNFGLVLTYASVYQMLRGSVVVMNAIMSVVFLKHKLYPHHWVGIILIMIGLLVVGSTSLVYGTGDNARNPIVGNILVVVSCTFAAAQFVIEEKIMTFYSAEPLEFVGWEGYWGLSWTVVVLFAMFFIEGNDAGSQESAPNALSQILTSWSLFASVVGSALSIAFFNFFGLSITKYASSTTRATIDACRTLFVWLVSLLLGWEVFRPLQLGGFAILVSGTFAYNEVLRVPLYSAWVRDRKKQDEEKKKQRETEKAQEIN
mmetsp:Transcript_10464/g.15298  ORF Transcript_10464/g.15298 Transcript_10464/m.15298 type:complete len:386 (-) Transcript_10464:20-1177(-)